MASMASSESPVSVTINTPKGNITGIRTDVPGATAAVIMVGGAGGGTQGPAGVYPDLAACLAEKGISGLRLDYRRPNDLAACVFDVRAGIAALQQRGIQRVALTGWSFGGAVVITAGAESDAVAGVATVASQTYGTQAVHHLRKPLLLLHGTADTTLSPSCSRQLYAQAPGPKELVLYDGDNHGITQHRQQMLDQLCDWCGTVLTTSLTAALPSPPGT